ncbi:class E sortase [Streptomyces yunnanensis]|uniref:Sortase A n=1 Tax=Streptomyces yunnanensis TaxID=156453 RepID=A0A9X8QWD6_9ACTN|nr:class E sortase [Streptomyces yunnanensis]SHM62894.1 sortase A [Streptomyces yunnanensis]
MTALRPEHEGRPYEPYEEQPSAPSAPYGQSDAFETAVGRLDDPLNDPLPGRSPAPHPAPYGQQAPTARADGGTATEGSPWFRPRQDPAASGRPEPPPTTPTPPRRPARHRKPGPEDATPGPPPPRPYGSEADAYGQVNGGLGHGRYTPPAEPIPDSRGVAEALTAPLPTIPPLLPSRSGRPARPAPAGAPSQSDDATMALRQAERSGDDTVSRETSATVSRETDADIAVSRETTTAALLTGGRAARRKAAQAAAKRGGRHGRRSARAASASAPAAATDVEAAKAPMTRVEARRAQRAAKDSPGLIASRALGEVFITLGVLMLLFVTYQLWWTNVMADEEAGGAASNLQHQWEQGGGEKKNLADGERFGIMYIPKLDVKAPIAQGIDKHSVLDHGMIGHYDAASGIKTAMPWDKAGNFAVAAHRNTHGEPFRYINRLTKGDKIVVETQSAYYTYEMESVLPQTSPSNTSVIGPVPPGSGFTGPGRYLTLTTCTPEFTSTYRLIVWGKMVDERPRSKGKPEALAG